MAEVREKAGEYALRIIVVFDEQDAQHARTIVARRPATILRAALVEVAIEDDCAAGAEAVARARHGDRAAMQLDQIFCRWRDRVRARRTACGVVVALLERLEQRVLPLRLDADAGVDDFKAETRLLVTSADLDLAAGSGEFDRVVDQVPEDLLDPHRVAPDVVVVRGPVRRDVQSFAVNVGLRGVERIARDGVCIGALQVQRDLARADARERSAQLVAEGGEKFGAGGFAVWSRCYRGPPNSELLQKEIMSRLEHAQFEPAIYNGGKAGVYLCGTVNFFIKDGKPHLRVFLNQEESDLLSGRDFVAPQYAFAPGNMDYNGIFYPPDAPWQAGVTSLKLNVTEQGAVTNAQVIYEYPPGKRLGAYAAGPVMKPTSFPVSATESRFQAASPGT